MHDCDDCYEEGWCDGYEEGRSGKYRNYRGVDHRPRGGGNKQGCYVATAVYGSYDCPQVWILRRFRDDCLLERRAGRLFVKAYYAVSPKLIAKFGGIGWLRNFTRNRLDQLVSALQKKGYDDAPYCDKM